MIAQADLANLLSLKPSSGDGRWLVSGLNACLVLNRYLFANVKRTVLTRAF